MTLITFIIAVVGGFAAGIINTLAGNGSVITLGILTELVGLPANIANGTNRIGIFIQSIGSYMGLKENISIQAKEHKNILLWTLIGAIVGTVAATLISNESFTVVYKFMMVVMLFTILAKPSRWIKPQTSPSVQKNPLLLIIFCLLVGFYGGFIQMGMGLIFLAVMVLLLKKQMMESNLLKVLVIMVYTGVALGIFIFKDMIHWQAGLSIALGQGLGGWLTGKYIARSPHANMIAYYTLLLAVVSVLIKMFLF